MREALHPAFEDRVYWGKVDGLTLILYPRACARRKQALLTVDYGSVDHAFSLERESPPERIETPAGVAHFLEHRIFEKSYGDISARFADLGAIVDAHTTMTETGYSVSCNDGFDEALHLLFELVFDPFFTEEGIARERAIIKRELELYQDDVDWVSYFTCLKSLYGDHPLAADIAGTRESIQEIDQRVLQTCHEIFYRPERAVLFLFGDLDIDVTWRRVESLVSGLRGRSSPRAVTLRSPATPRPNRSWHVMSVAEPRIAMAYHDSSSPAGAGLLKRELTLELVMDILFGSSSEFYTREYFAGLIEEESFSWEVQAETGHCFCLISGDCQEPELLEQRVQGEIEDSIANDVIPRDWERAVRKMYGSLVSRFEEGQDCAEMVVAAVRQGCEPFAYLQALSEIAVEDAERALQSVFRPDGCGVSTVFPAP